MLPPDLPAFFFHAATGIRRSSPCAAAAFCAVSSQVITKPGVGARAQTPFLHLRTPTRLFSRSNSEYSDYARHNTWNDT